VPRIYLRLDCLHVDLAWPVTDLFVDPFSWKQNISNWKNDVVVDSVNLLLPQQSCGSSFQMLKAATLGETVLSLLWSLTNGSETAAAPRSSYPPRMVARQLLTVFVGSFVASAHVVPTGEMAREKACLEVSSVGPIPETLLAVGMNAGTLLRRGGGMKMKNRL